MRSLLILHYSLIFKELDKESALNRTVAEALFNVCISTGNICVAVVCLVFACDRVVPVGHRNAGGSDVERFPHRSNKILEAVAVFSECSRPDEPVALGVGILLSSGIP